MPFQQAKTFPDFAKLKATFVGAKDQIKDYLLFQTIIQFLDASAKSQKQLIADVDEAASSGGDLTAIYLTGQDESATLINSRNVVAGTGIVFDDSVANERTVSADVSGVGYWTPLILSTNPGDSELILTDADAPIAVFTPTP